MSPRRNAHVKQRRRPRRRRKWPWLIGGASLLAAVFAPQIITSGPILNAILASVSARLPGPVTVASASASWWGPTRLRGVAASDRAGRDLVQIDAVELPQSAAALLFSGGQVTEIAAHRPRLQIALHSGGSNLQDYLDKLTQLHPLEVADAPASETGVPAPLPRVTVAHGEVAVVDAAGAELWAMRELTVASQSIDDAPQGTAFHLNGQFFDQGAAAGTIQAVAQIRDATARRINFEIGASNAPLSGAVAALAASLGSPRLSGTAAVSARGEIDLNAAAPQGSIESQVTLSNVHLLCDELPPAGLRLTQVSCPVKVVLRDGTAIIEQIEIDSEPLLATLSGSAPLPIDGRPVSFSDVLHRNLVLAGQCRLPALAAAAPGLIPLEEGVTLTDGAVDFSISAGAKPGALDVRAAVSPIAAQTASGPVRWEAPLHLQTLATIDGDALRVDKAICQSDFLAFSGYGDAMLFVATATCDLAKLSQELSKFLTAEVAALAGQGKFEFRWQADPSGAATADARGSLDNLQLGGGPQPWFRESRIQLVAQARGKSDQGQVELEQGQVDVSAAGDRFTAWLTAPLKLGEQLAAPQMQIDYTGDLTGWGERLAVLGLGDDWRVAGQAKLQCTAGLVDDEFSLANGVLEVGNLKAENADWRIDEPLFQAKFTGGRFRATPLRCDLTNVFVTGRAVQSTINRLSIEQPSDAPLRIAGDGAAAADLAFAVHWSKAPAKILPGGKIDLQFHSNERGVFTADGVIDELTLQQIVAPGEAPRIIWREQQPRFQLQIAPGADETKLQVQVASRLIGASATGAMTTAGAGSYIDLRGQYNYDLATASQILASEWEEIFTAQGVQTRSFALRGPITPPNDAEDFELLQALTAEFDFGWDGADVLGVQIGQAAMNARLADGVLAVEPFRTPVNQGFVNFATTFRLSPEPALLLLPPGRAVENVDITPQTCSRGLKFVNPFLADATRISGRFSVQMDGADVPLADPAAGSFGGSLEIHGAEFRPGPLAEQLIAVATRVEMAIKAISGEPPRREVVFMTIPEQAVRFLMKEGRVYHDQLEMHVGDVVVRTQGSVGVVDESLALIVSFPIQEKWVRGTSSLRPLVGQVVQTPVAGTMRQPQIDLRALDQLNRDLLQKTGEAVLRDQLQRGLERLLRPRD